MLGTFTVANFVGGTQVLYPILVKFQLAPDWTARGMQFETVYALLTTIASIGGVVGGLFISAWGGLKAHRIYGVLVPMIIDGVATIFFGGSRWLFLSAGAIALSLGDDAHPQRTLASHLADTDAARAGKGAFSRCAGSSHSSVGRPPPF